MSTGTFQFSFRQWHKEGGAPADVPVPPHQLLDGSQPRSMLRAVWCPWLGTRRRWVGQEGPRPCSLSAGRVFSGSAEGRKGVLEGHSPGCRAAGPAAGLELGCSVPSIGLCCRDLDPGRGRGDAWSWVPRVCHGSFPSVPPRQPLPHLSAPAQTLTGQIKPQHLPETTPTAF